MRRVDVGSRFRQTQRLNGIKLFAGYVQQLPAGNQNMDIGPSREQLPDGRRGFDDVLEIIQDQKQVFRLQVMFEPFQRRL